MGFEMSEGTGQGAFRRWAFGFLLASMVWAAHPSFGQAFDQRSLDLPNTEHDEQAPMLSPDGKALYYTVAGHPGNIAGKKDTGDIWYSTWEGNRWSAPVHAGKLVNDEGYNTVIGFSHDGNRIFLAFRGRSSYNIPTFAKKLSNQYILSRPVKPFRFFLKKRFLYFYNDDKTKTQKQTI